MTSRLGSAFSSCALKSHSESVEVITTDDDVNEEVEQSYKSTENTAAATPDQPQSGLLWRLSSGAIGGVYNVASGAAGMSYSGTKWVLGKGVEIGSNVAEKSKDISGNVMSKTAQVGSSLVSIIPLPSKLKGKDKKE